MTLEIDAALSIFLRHEKGTLRVGLHLCARREQRRPVSAYSDVKMVSAG